VSTSFTPPLVGRIDTLGVAYEVEGDFRVDGASLQVSRLGMPEETRRYRHALPGGGFVNLGIAGKAWVEASLPKRGGSDNVNGLAVGDALEVARQMWGEASAFCTPDRRRGGHRFERAKVVRLDSVRDFQGVRHVPELLDGLTVVPGRDSRWKARRFQDAESNRAETLRVGPGAHGHTLYDKHAETRGLAPVGQLRYEARLHQKQLVSDFAVRRGVVIRQVGDVSSDKVCRLGRLWFDRVRFGLEVAGMATCADAVFSAQGLSVDSKATLWAFLTAPGFSSMLSRPARYKYRDLALSLGVTPEAASSETAPVFVRLDYDGGVERVRAA
jgi:hypothetical protein